MLLQGAGINLVEEYNATDLEALFDYFTDVPGSSIVQCYDEKIFKESRLVAGVSTLQSGATLCGMVLSYIPYGCLPCATSATAARPCACPVDMRLSAAAMGHPQPCCFCSGGHLRRQTSGC